MSRGSRRRAGDLAAATASCVYAYPTSGLDGGHNYQRNLFAALSRFRPGEFAPILFAGTGAIDADLAPFAAIEGVEVVRSAAFEGGGRVAEAVALGLDAQAAAEFRAQRIDAVFESARFFGWRLSYPAVAWFPTCNTAHCRSSFRPQPAGAER
jgi:hypothetical protein